MSEDEILALIKKGDFYDIADHLRTFMPDELHVVLFDFIAGRMTHNALIEYLSQRVKK